MEVNPLRKVAKRILDIIVQDVAWTNCSCENVSQAIILVVLQKFLFFNIKNVDGISIIKIMLITYVTQINDCTYLHANLFFSYDRTAGISVYVLILIIFHMSVIIQTSDPGWWSTNSMSNNFSFFLAEFHAQTPFWHFYIL